MKQFFVYILADRKYGVLYIGVSSHLFQRIGQHKEGVTKGFVGKYGTKMLVYYELHDSAEAAILREKQMKKWRRMWKIDLIEKMNPSWKNLSVELGFESVGQRFPPARE